MEPDSYSITRTPNALADVVRASRSDVVSPGVTSNCAFCSETLTRNSSQVIGRCSKCGAPQPLSPNEDYFSVLGAPKKFSQNKSALETAFYALSRELHPDRFAAGSDPKWKTISLERMSRVNEAYRVLTKRDELRAYLLSVEGFQALDGQSGAGAKSKAQIPMELAEEWFELQEAMMDDPIEGRAKAAAFEQALDARVNREETEIQTLEARYDESGSKDALASIEKLLLEGQYLKSLKRDVLKLKGVSA